MISILFSLLMTAAQTPAKVKVGEVHYEPAFKFQALNVSATSSDMAVATVRVKDEGIEVTGKNVGRATIQVVGKKVRYNVGIDPENLQELIPVSREFTIDVTPALSRLTKKLYQDAKAALQEAISKINARPARTDQGSLSAPPTAGELSVRHDRLQKEWAFVESGKRSEADFILSAITAFEIGLGASWRSDLIEAAYGVSALQRRFKVKDDEFIRRRNDLFTELLKSNAPDSDSKLQKFDQEWKSGLQGEEETILTAYTKVSNTVVLARGILSQKAHQLSTWASKATTSKATPASLREALVQGSVELVRFLFQQFDFKLEDRPLPFRKKIFGSGSVGPSTLDYFAVVSGSPDRLILSSFVWKTEPKVHRMTFKPLPESMARTTERGR